MEERRIPRTMSTQHPDNARLPRWVHGEVIEGDQEVEEAYLAYRSYGCQEVMWDAEGKDVDTHVVRKLLSQYPSYFRKTVMGRDVFLTYRVPNPVLDAAEKKVITETLDNIPLAYDVAKQFYGEGAVAPIFEVIMPFTHTSDDLANILNYYEKAVAGREALTVNDAGLTVREWIGEVNPKRINVIPLFEDVPSLLQAAEVVRDFIKRSKTNYVRAFLGRSDPAMSFGMIPATLSVKFALWELRRVEEQEGVRVYPILGAGSLPFRGHVSPRSYASALKTYPGVYTITIQSAFKYDYDEAEAEEAVSALNSSQVRDPDEPTSLKDLLEAIDRLAKAYVKEASGLAHVVNKLTTLLPSRRARKPHSGPFGYGRKVGSKSLPRAIAFTGALYSIGLPPELLGLHAMLELSRVQRKQVEELFPLLPQELEAATNFFSWECFNTMREEGVWGIKIQPSLNDLIEKDLKAAEELGIDIGPKDSDGMRHGLFASACLESLNSGHPNDALFGLVGAAEVRRSLGRRVIPCSSSGRKEDRDKSNREQHEQEHHGQT
ncbi:MAG: phosphoenolpyruvate carboxylase [TACK group archaeon]|nr:phosphoenolpyruvate carboxylase [TACK group archaeon]